MRALLYIYGPAATRSLDTMSPRGALAKARRVTSREREESASGKGRDGSVVSEKVYADGFTFRARFPNETVILR